MTESNESLKTFIHHDIPKPQRIDSPDGRLYQSPSGNLYPSVTTILSKVQDKSYLDEWVTNVGEEVASRITKEAADRGTLLHKQCENYLLGEKIVWHPLHAIEREMFGYFKPVLQSVDNIHGIELPLWSDTFRCAGTVDLIADYEGKLSILDWKNSLRYKSVEDIPHYFMQMAAYSLMFYERTRVQVKELVVVISAKDYGLVVHKQPMAPWAKEFIKLRKAYDEITEAK